VIDIPKEQRQNIEKYWSFYRSYLSDEVKNDFSNQIQDVIAEINQFILKNELVEFIVRE
jgi:hypothetical protein